MTTQADKKLPIRANMRGNSMRVLQPHWHADTWVFNEPSKRLAKEESEKKGPRNDV